MEKLRLAHVVSDSDSRLLKGKKIVALVGNERIKQMTHILEVGCGSGIVLTQVGALAANNVSLTGVDVADNRIDKSSFRFFQVTNTSLPFEDSSFDLVISNHVIEHVGDRAQQLHHLREIRRVLKADGVMYLAHPNKWELMEPHYRLPLLSWLPRSLADAWVRSTGKHNHYDCFPLSFWTTKKIARDAGLHIDVVSNLALRAWISIERSNDWSLQLINKLAPDWALRLLYPIIPTHVYLLRK